MNSAASAFTVSSPLPTRTSSTTTSSSLAVVGSFTAVVSRRDFAFQTTAAAVAAFALGTALIAAPSVATAAATDVDGTDLAMPTLEQQQLDTDAVRIIYLFVGKYPLVRLNAESYSRPSVSRTAT
jgi:hypothetical protein